MKNKYLVAGLVIETDIDFKEFVHTEENATVKVKYGKVPEELQNVTTQKVLFSCNDQDEVLFKMPNVARFLIEGNNSVTIELIDDSRNADAETSILSFVLGVLSYKSGVYPFHGGGIIHNDEVYLFIGHSGAGKSTTISGLAQRGFQAIGDDISNIFVKDNKVFVHPCFPRIKLWPDSLEILNQKDVGEYKWRTDINKLLIPMKGFPKKPYPLKRIYLLIKNDELSFKKLNGSQQILPIKNNSYKPWMVSAFGLNKEHFHLMNRIAANVEFFEFRRPKHKESIDNMFDRLINHIKSE